MKTTNQAAPTMVPARDLKDYRLAPSWPDIRGWEVVTPTGAAVGVVDRLMIEPSVQQPRYVSVVAEPNGPAGKPVHRAILPVGAVSAAPGQNRVFLSKEAAAAWPTLTALPTETVNLETELAVLSALGTPVPKTEPQRVSYQTPMFDPRGLIERTATPLKK